MKRIIFTILVLKSFTTAFISINAQGIKVITLEKAIEIAQNNSFAYQIARYNQKLRDWDLKQFESTFYPKITLESTAPNYRHTIHKVTLPSGSDTFVSQNQSYSNISVNIEQIIPWTGSQLQIQSFFDRIDIFGSNPDKRFAIQPFSISIYHNNLFYNEIKWQRKIESLKAQVGNKEFLKNMEEIALETLQLFFEGLQAQFQFINSKENHQQSATLLKNSENRMKLGNVNKGHLLQLELNLLNNLQQFTQDSLKWIMAKQNFSKHLLFMENTIEEFEIPDNIIFTQLNFDSLYGRAVVHGINHASFNLQKLSAEQNLKKISSENHLKLRFSAHLGTSNFSQSFQSLWSGMENQQQIVLGISLPILDWNYSKINKLKAETMKEILNVQIQKNESELQQQIAFYINKWNIHEKQMSLALKSEGVAMENYKIEQEKFAKGLSSLYEMNRALLAKDLAKLLYIQYLYEYWEIYYQLRGLTLYDFIKNKVIQY